MDEIEASRKLAKEIFGDRSFHTLASFMGGSGQIWICIYPNVYIDKSKIPETFEGYEVVIKENFEVKVDPRDIPRV